MTPADFLLLAGEVVAQRLDLELYEDVLSQQFSNAYPCDWLRRTQFYWRLRGLG